MYWVLEGAISLDITYILMRVTKVVVNINPLLSVTTSLSTGNLMKLRLWCPLSSCPCFLLQAVQVEKRDGCRQRERKPSILCCSVNGDTAIYQRFHSNHESITSEYDCCPPTASAKYLSTWHWVPAVAAKRTINLEGSKPWKSAVWLLDPRHKSLWCITEEPAWEETHRVSSAFQTDTQAEKHKNNTECISLW